LRIANTCLLKVDPASDEHGEQENLMRNSFSYGVGVEALNIRTTIR